MDEIDLTQFDEDGFTVKLVGPPGLIAVDTLIETLAGFTESLQAIGASVDPEYELEVFVDRVAPGTINIGVRLSRHLRKNAKAYALAGGIQVIVGLFTNYLYDQIKPQETCEVVVGADKVIVKGRSCHVTIHREVYDLKPRIDSNPRVAKGIERGLKAVRRDHAIKSVGIGAWPDMPPVVTVTRAHFDEALRRLGNRQRPMHKPKVLIGAPEASVAETRQQHVRANLTVIKAVLLRSRRKWQFSWQGIKISAPITDPNFFDQLEARSVALRQGDALDADLTITQRLLADANVWVNRAYEVTKVYGVQLGTTQMTMDFTSPIDGDASTTRFRRPRAESEEYPKELPRHLPPSDDSSSAP